MDVFTWIGILFCLSQSAMFSGLNLAFFSITRLRLEVEASTGDEAAQKVLDARQDSNFLLTTILWGNVGINVLLALLSNSVMSGVVAFFFSTFVITLAGEIMPQAYFSRHALRMASLLLPVLRMYQFLLYPVAKPSARMLDWWIGPEGIQFLKERNLRQLLRKHIESAEADDIDRLEGLGALNFLAIDDIRVQHEGEPVDERSIITLPVSRGRPVFPEFERRPDDAFLRSIQASGKKWVIVVDEAGKPSLAIDSDGFLRAALFSTEPLRPYHYCHRPIIVRDPTTRLGNVISRLKVEVETAGDDVVDQDIILLWSEDRRIITGADLLGRLLRGITMRKTAPGS